MEIKSGEIKVAPKQVYWIEAPLDIDPEVHIELLKKDIFLIAKTWSEFLEESVVFNKRSVYIFHMDNILRKGRTAEAKKELFKEVTSTVIHKLQKQAVMHTATIQEQVRDRFLQSGIYYLEKNPTDSASIISLVLQSVTLTIPDNNRERAFVRIIPEAKTAPSVRVRLKNAGAIQEEGRLKDFSLGGLGIQLSEEKNIMYPVRSWVEVYLLFPRAPVRVKQALVTRWVPETREVGLQFQVTDDSMIEPNYARIYTSLIHKYLSTILHGRQEAPAEAEPDKEEMVPQMSASDLYYQGLSYFSAENFEEAKKVFESILRIRKFDSTKDVLFREKAQFSLSQTLRKMGQHLVAKTTLEDFIRKHPSSENYFPALMLAVEMDLEKNQTEQAKARLREVIKDDHDRARKKKAEAMLSQLGG